MVLDGVFIATHGSGATPSIVLVHGAPDRSSTFRDVLTELADCRVVVYDRRGYGRSIGASAAASMDDHAADLLEILSSLAPPRVVVAHSFGANPTMLAVAQRPQLFGAVGLWEPPLVWSDIWPQSVREYNASVASSNDPGATIEAAYRRLLGDRWDTMSPEGRRERRSEGAAFQLDMACGLAPPCDFDEVVVPAMVGYGTKTRPSHVDGARWLAGRLPSAMVHLIPGAGHYACRTHPREYANFVRSVVALAE